MPFQFTCARCGKSFTRLHKRKPPKFCSLVCRDAPRSGLPGPEGSILVPLTQGKFAIIDREDADRILGHNWCYAKGGYAVRGVTAGGRRRIYMHREILGLVHGEEHGDHINGDRLDNRRANLRSASRSENMANTRRRADNASGYKGVGLHKKTGKWRARVSMNGVQSHLGLFDSPEQAALARDRAASEIQGKFSRLNDIDGDMIR